MCNGNCIDCSHCIEDMEIECRICNDEGIYLDEGSGNTEYCGCKRGQERQEMNRKQLEEEIPSEPVDDPYELIMDLHEIEEEMGNREDEVLDTERQTDFDC